MRENAVAAKEEQALATEASHASCAGRSATETGCPTEHRSRVRAAHGCNAVAHAYP